MKSTGGFMRVMSGAAFALACLLPWFSADAVDRGKQVSITRKDHVAKLMDAVENAVWAADGQAAQKPVYVVYNTDCAFSQRFFQESRALAGKVQFRWIPVHGEEALDVVNLRNGSAVANAFANRRERAGDPAAAQRRLDYNKGVENSINYQMRGYDNSRTFAYPTLIYQTANGVKVVAGAPKSLSALAAEVSAQPRNADIVPAALAITAQPLQVAKSRNLPKWYHEQPAPVLLRAAPSQMAVAVDDLDKDLLVPVSGIVAGTGWIEVAQYGPTGPKAYVHDPLMARMALLDYRVKPQGGNWDAHGTTEVRGFPDSEAPVLETLRGGERYRRSGVVELDGRVWDQIVLYVDGTVGYVARS